MKHWLFGLAAVFAFADATATPRPAVSIAKPPVPDGKQATTPVDLRTHPDAVHLNVVATAYNGTHKQTDDTPLIGAWGDRLDRVKDARVMAVSRDLLQKGLTRGKRVKIHGYAGEFVVLDKMPKRWKNRIDLYMGKDITAARRFGKKKVKISFVPHAAKKPAMQKSSGPARPVRHPQ